MRTLGYILFQHHQSIDLMFIVYPLLQNPAGVVFLAYLSRFKPSDFTFMGNSVVYVVTPIVVFELKPGVPLKGIVLFCKDSET